MWEALAAIKLQNHDLGMVYGRFTTSQSWDHLQWHGFVVHSRGMSWPFSLRRSMTS